MAAISPLSSGIGSHEPLTNSEKSLLIVNAVEKAEEFLLVEWANGLFNVNNLTPLEMDMLWQCKPDLFNDVMSIIYDELTNTYVELCRFESRHDWHSQRLQLLKELYLLAACERAADDGNGYAQYFTAYCFAHGIGQPVNWTRAIYYYEMAISAGVPQAMCEMGYLYLNGKEVIQDIPKGMDLIRKAAAYRCAEAKFHLGMCYQNAFGIEYSDTKAVQCFIESAALEYPPAFKALGDCYANGNGVEVSRKKAEELYIEAGLRGSFKAVIARAHLVKPSKSKPKCNIM